MSGARGRLAGLAIALLAAALPLAPGDARADDADDALVSAASAALTAGRPADAIASYEALADRGVVDPHMSFDRGLAYAQRVRLGADLPGDLGRAAHGFEEARALTEDPRLAESASHAILLVRAEVARRRARAGEPPSVDPGAPPFRALVELFPENAWAYAALVASVLLGIGLFVRAISSSRRGRIGGAIVASLSAPALAFFAVMALGARDERLHRRDGVVVAAGARATDELHRPIDAVPLPEAAHVSIVDSRAGWTHVRWASVDGWIPSSAVRPIARAE
jgi:hypothetical protein